MMINGREYWRPRTRTKSGYAVPRPRFGPRRYGQASTAQRRREDRIADRVHDDQIVTLEPGTLIIVQREPYRVVEVREIPPDLWGDEWQREYQSALDRWDAHPRGDRPTERTWWDRPVSIVVCLADSPEAKPGHMRVSGSYKWDVLPEHYAVCHACGEIPPCRHELTEDKIREQMILTEELMTIPAGYCLSCGEAVTSRMKATRFPGPNLWRPDLGDNSAVFHTRQECSHDVDRYRKQWQESRQQDEPEQLSLEEDA